MTIVIIIIILIIIIMIMPIFSVVQGGPRRAASCPGDALYCLCCLYCLIRDAVIENVKNKQETWATPCLDLNYHCHHNNLFWFQRAEKLEEARQPKRIRNKQTVEQVMWMMGTMMEITMKMMVMMMIMMMVMIRTLQDFSLDLTCDQC